MKSENGKCKACTSDMKTECDMTTEGNDACGATTETDTTEGVVTPETMTGRVETRDDLEERLAETEAKASENWNMYLRALADLDNYRRRSARDLAFHIRSGKKDMILKLLAVVDDMERALAAEADYEALSEGVEMIMRKLLDILAAEGLAVSALMYSATGNRRLAFLWALLAGIAEPLGAVLAAVAMAPNLNDTIISIMLTIVAGIMVFISLDELIPVSRSFGEDHLSIIGIIMGMAVMAASTLIF
jgi:molecular chaperone GrpE (heat shock protein)